jgi:uncharacterized protein YndB with AHSA1/START domain
MISNSIEIDRPPEDVFAYIDDLDRHGEWQDAIIKARKEPPSATRVGTRNFETRRVPGGPREFVSEIIEHDPPRRIVAGGLTGPLRPTLTLTIEPLDNGSRSRFTLEMDLSGRGMGKVLAFFARRSAREQVPRDQARLKEILEGRK